MISTRELTRDFVVSRTETVHAVRGISLDVEPGELVAVLGPNGAGKTTTLRMLTTLITPTSGTATVAGYDVTAQPSQVRRRIGYVGQGNGAGHSQRVGDELVGQGVIYGLDRRAAKRRTAELVEALELTELVNRKVSELSGGQRRRLVSRWGWYTHRRCCSWTSRRPASTRRTARTCGTTSCGCASSTR